MEKHTIVSKKKREREKQMAFNYSYVQTQDESSENEKLDHTWRVPKLCSKIRKCHASYIVLRREFEENSDPEASFPPWER